MKILKIILDLLGTVVLQNFEQRWKEQKTQQLAFIKMKILYAALAINLLPIRLLWKRVKKIKKLIFCINKLPIF